MDVDAAGSVGADTNVGAWFEESCVGNEVWVGRLRSKLQARMCARGRVFGTDARDWKPEEPR